MKTIISLLSEDNIEIRNMKISDLKVDENYISNVSIQKYNNYEPCVIIRSRIANNLYINLNEYIKDCKKKGRIKIEIDDLPEMFKKNIVWESGVKSISLN